MTPDLALLMNDEGTVALAVGGCLAWYAPHPRQNARKGTTTGQTPPPPAYPMLRLVTPPVAPQPPTGPWSVLSTDTDIIHEVLVRTGIFDQLVSTLSERMSKRTGPLKVWLPDVGFVPLKWMIRNYRGEE